MSLTEKYLVGMSVTLLSTELNALANNSLAVTATAFNNLAGGGGGDGLVLCDVELVVTFGVAPSINSGLSIWFLAGQDGTNYEDGADGTTTPYRAADLVLPTRATTTLQRPAKRVLLPWGTLKVLLKNDGTGQAFAATGNTLKIRPATYQGV